MMRRKPFLSLLLLLLLGLFCSRQDPEEDNRPPSTEEVAGLEVVHVFPTGKVESVEETNEIVIVFSDPMIALEEIPRKVEEGKDKIILKFENPKEIGIQQAEDIISVLKHIGSLKVNLKFVIPSKEAINKLKGFYELQDIKIYSDEEEAIKEFNK